MRHFALFGEGLDSVDFDNESAHYWVCFSSSVTTTPLRSKGCVVGDRESYSATSHHYGWREVHGQNFAQHANIM